MITKLRSTIRHRMTTITANVKHTHTNTQDKTERTTGLGRRTRGYIEKWDQTDSPEIPDRG